MNANQNQAALEATTAVGIAAVEMLGLAAENLGLEVDRHKRRVDLVGQMWADLYGKRSRAIAILLRPCSMMISSLGSGMAMPRIARTQEKACIFVMRPPREETVPPQMANIQTTLLNSRSRSRSQTTKNRHRLMRMQK